MGELAEKRVLVTGGAGFIGSEVVRQLVYEGADIAVLDDFSSGKMEYIEKFDGIRIVKGDVCDDETISRGIKNQELVVHLAALPFIPDCYYHPEEFFRVNAMGTVKIMQESIRSKAVEKFIHVSSSEVYGTARYVPMDEEHPTLPHSTYAVSKLAADRAVFSMLKEHGFPAVIIRPFNSYGPNVTQPYIVPEIALQLLSHGNSVQLGNVDSSRDFTYVEDTARGIVMASTCSKAAGETINLGSGRDVQIKELVFLMAELLGKRVKIRKDSSRLRPYDVDRLLCDPTKAKRILGWQPNVSLREGLERTIEWIAGNPVRFKGPFKGWYQYYYT
ncbi:MAG: GDP-mannose 4,6-dehydratase [Candidatus Bathyarchaeia archaeon]